MSVSTMARFIARAPDIRHAKLLQRGLECVEVVIAFVAPGGHRRGFCIRGGLVSGLADDLLGDSEPLGGAQRTQLREDLFGGDALLIDERRGRAVAAARGIAVIGTLGIVAGARRLGVLERAAPVVAELRADGFWLSDGIVAELLSELGESP